MSDITLVDINELASTISKDKDMLFVVEVPSGGGFIQRKVTKEVMFQLLGNNLDYTTSPGSKDVITFDGPSGNKVVYINNGSTGVMIFKVGVLGVSADGATNIIQMDTAGALRLGLGTTDGTLRILEDLELYEFTGRDLEQNVIVDLDIQDAATTEAVECRNSIAYLEVAAGGTIPSHTIQFPALARVGYTFEFYVKGTVTALTLDGGAATVDEALTTVTDGGGKWVRVVTGGGVGVASWRRVRADVPKGEFDVNIVVRVRSEAISQIVDLGSTLAYTCTYSSDKINFSCEDNEGMFVAVNTWALNYNSAFNYTWIANRRNGNDYFECRLFNTSGSVPMPDMDVYIKYKQL